jgi:hypothetical protein
MPAERSRIFMKATRESTAVSVVTSVGEEFADAFDQVDVAGPDHTVAEFVIEHTGPMRCPPRQKSRVECLKAKVEPL